MLSWYSFLCENGPKTTFFDLKIVKHLIKVSVFYWYLIQFWPVNYSFEGKNMNYKMVQNLSQSVGRIKKSIFIPSSIRVFSFSSRHKWLNWFWILLHRLIMVNCIALIYSLLLALEIMIFTLFLSFEHYFDALIWTGQNTISTRPMEIFQVSLNKNYKEYPRANHKSTYVSILI